MRGETIAFPSKTSPERSKKKEKRKLYLQELLGDRKVKAKVRLRAGGALREKSFFRARTREDG